MAVLTCTHKQCFEQKYQKYQNFSNEIFNFCFRKKNLFIAWARFVMFVVCLKDKGHNSNKEIERIDVGLLFLDCYTRGMYFRNAWSWFNPYMLNVPAHHYHLSESTFILRAPGVIFFLFHFSIKFLKANQMGRRVQAILFAYVP